MKRTPFHLITAFIVLGIASVAIAFTALASNDEQVILNAKAERLFAQERLGEIKLPAHRLRALSVALAFHDHAGAKRIIEELEHSEQR
jgi:hypothetical protein